MRFSNTFSVIVASSVLLVASMMILPIALKQNFGPLPYAKSQPKNASQGHPDMFFQYYHDIRADENGVVNYPMSYRTTELHKALERFKTMPSRIAWVERGPGNVGGRTRPILVDPDDPTMNTWWAGAVGGGLWKTTDRGHSWEDQSGDVPLLSVSSLAMSGDVIYMGTGEGFGKFGGIDGEGIFKSTDRGSTWTHLLATATNSDFRHVNRLAVDPENPDILVAATGTGIFRTADGGFSWSRVFSVTLSNDRLGRVLDLRAQPGNFNRMIAGVNDRGIVVSDDAGLTWTFAPAKFINGASRIELAYSPSNPDIAYAAIEAFTSYLMRSDDGGETWVPSYNASGFPVNWMGQQGWYNNSLAVHPFNPDTIFVGGIYLYRIRIPDGGERFDIAGPTLFDRGETVNWMGMVNFSGNGPGGLLDYLRSDAVDITSADYPSQVEIRFGRGTQKAHRFTVAEDAGSDANGGAGVPFTEHLYADYVDVPFQVWDTENNRQLTVSFRDQADDGEFNLINFLLSQDPGTRDSQSREYLLIHKYDYDDTNPHPSIGAERGLVQGLLYFLWPFLLDRATWRPDALPQHEVSINFSRDVDVIRMIVDYDGISNSNDNWATISPHVDHHAIVPLPVAGTVDDFWILNTNDGGVALSTDGGRSFHETDAAPSGYNTSQFWGVSKKPGAPLYAGGTQDNGIWRSPLDPGSKSEWYNVFLADGFETIWHATNPNKVLTTIQLNQIFRSTNGGVYFDFLSSFPGRNRSRSLFFTSLATSESAPDVVFTLVADGVYRSMDFGDTWQKFHINTPNWQPWFACKVRASNPDPNIVWAGCGMNNSDTGHRFHVSKDQGETFTVTGPATVPVPPEAIISGMATHPTEPGTAYGLFSVYGRAKLLETKDTGSTWVDLSAFDPVLESSTNGFPDVPVHDVVVMPHATHVMWVGTDIGIFQSTNNGEDWSYANNGFPPVSAYRLKVRDDEVIVGTHGRGMWTVPTSEISDTKVAIEDATTPEFPSGFTLAQNYPNPFNPVTTVSFTVTEEARVTITIFDAVGRRISVLTDRIYSPGGHEIAWDAHLHPSGTYFYRMEAGGVLLQTRKMTLVK